MSNDTIMSPFDPGCFVIGIPSPMMTSLECTVLSRKMYTQDSVMEICLLLFLFYIFDITKECLPKFKIDEDTYQRWYAWLWEKQHSPAQLSAFFHLMSVPQL